MSISMPTPSSSRITPSSPRTLSVWLDPTKPRMDGPMMTPATISPTTAGTLIRSAISAASFAATSTTRMSRRIVPTSMQCDVSSAGAVSVDALEEVAASPHRADLETKGRDPPSKALDVNVERVAGRVDGPST